LLILECQFWNLMVEGINTYRLGFMPFFESIYTTGQINKVQGTNVNKPEDSEHAKKFQYKAPTRTPKDRFTRTSKNPEDRLETDYTKFLFRGRPSESEEDKATNAPQERIDDQEGTTNEKKISDLPTDKKGVGDKELTDAEKQKVEELKKIDREVRAHEAAHKAAGGSLVTGGASYTYTTGPDGMKYVTGGEVQIDISYDLDNPQSTIDKMRQVRRAAMAPADPSAQDRSVAAKASQIEARARAELYKQQNSESQTSINGMMKKNKDSRISAYQSSENATIDSQKNSINMINFQGKQTLENAETNLIKM
jgi:hypothetical protein